MGIKGWNCHECRGPITRKATIKGYYYEWRTCDECGEESLAACVNVAAIAKMKFDVEKEE